MMMQNSGAGNLLAPRPLRTPSPDFSFSFLCRLRVLGARHSEIPILRFLRFLRPIPPPPIAEANYEA